MELTEGSDGESRLCAWKDGTKPPLESEPHKSILFRRGTFVDFDMVYTSLEKIARGVKPQL